METYFAKKGEIKPDFYRVDAAGKVLGRLATRVATILQGKHKVVWTPHTDTGDFVIVTNADKFRVTGNKLSEKVYRRYSGYPGGLKEESLERVLSRKPKMVIETAVRRMLPKSKLGRKMLKRLRLYIASEKPVIPKKAKELAV